MESGVAVLTALKDAPSRTLHNAPLVQSSPLPRSVRAMLETRAFGRCYDAFPVDLEAIQHRLPALPCPSGDVEFLANDRSFDELNFSVDCLLQHRKKLVAASVDRNRRRKHVLVLGAGPGGLMTAVQLSLRNHRVILCEQREVYGRNRYIGVYKEVTHLMAALGMPERMTYDFSQYRGKRGIMLADIQTFLHGVALKLGVIIYMGAIARTLNQQVLRAGEIELQRTTKGTTISLGQSSIGMTRWQFDTVSRVRSGVSIRFDTIVEATGGRSGLRELLVGPENVVSIRTVGQAAALRDPSLESFFADPEDHCAEYVESGYGCPPGLRESFAQALRAGGEGEIPDEVPSFVSNIDASIFTKPMQQTASSLGLASHIGDRDLSIPHDWVVLECRLADQSLSRYHIEGPLPQTFEFGGQRLSTREALEKLNPVSLLFRILYAMGVPFDAVDRRRLIEFYTAESSHGDTSDIVSTWVGAFRGLRLGGEKPLWCGFVPGSDTGGIRDRGRSAAERVVSIWSRRGRHVCRGRPFRRGPRAHPGGPTCRGPTFRTSDDRPECADFVSPLCGRPQHRPGRSRPGVDRISHGRAAQHGSGRGAVGRGLPTRGGDARGRERYCVGRRRSPPGSGARSFARILLSARLEIARIAPLPARADRTRPEADDDGRSQLAFPSVRCHRGSAIAAGSRTACASLCPTRATKRSRRRAPAAGAARRNWHGPLRLGQSLASRLRLARHRSCGSRRNGRSHPRRNGLQCARGRDSERRALSRARLATARSLRSNILRSTRCSRCGRSVYSGPFRIRFSPGSQLC